MCCQCCSVRQQKIWVFGIGSLVTVLGIVLVTAWPTIAMSIIRSMLPLAPDSYVFSKWQSLPVPLYMTFYLFNWTNPHEVNNPLVKPHFEQLGPYVFRETKIKEDLVWHNDNSTVTYFARRTWFFDDERSNGTVNDLIITPNIPTITASSFTRNWPKFVGKILNFALNREGGALTMEHTAIEWLFDGFYDDLFDFVERLHSPLLPVYDNHFAWFYQRNDSKEAEGTYTIHTGKSDLTQMGDLKLWNGTAQTGYWEGECGKVNGSTGDLWTPGKGWDEPLTIFIYDAGRFINLFPQEKVKFHGIETWLYNSTNQTFDSGYVAPDTKCFCVKGRECPKNGVIDYSPAALGAPVYMSHPHFYMADPMYYENITGISPDPEKHNVFLQIEPILGVPIDMIGQVQLSLLVEPDERLDLLRDVAHKFYAPIFIIQLKAEISDDILDFLKFALGVPALGQYIGIGCIVLGVIMLVVGSWLTWTHNWRGDNKVIKQEPEPQTEVEAQTEAQAEAEPKAQQVEKF